MKNKMWESYEQVAGFILSQMIDNFGLKLIEGKQSIKGKRSGTKWEIDGKGILKNGEGFIIIECRRYTTSRQKQENIAALSYRIIDTGAKGGIMVSPLGLQEGAKKIAEAENIIDVHLDENSTTKDYILRFLNQVFVGVSDSVHATETVIVIKNKIKQ